MVIFYPRSARVEGRFDVVLAGPFIQVVADAWTEPSSEPAVDSRNIWEVTGRERGALRKQVVRGLVIRGRMKGKRRVQQARSQMQQQGRRERIVEIHADRLRKNILADDIGPWLREAIGFRGFRAGCRIVPGKFQLAADIVINLDRRNSSVPEIGIAGRSEVV